MRLTTGYVPLGLTLAAVLAGLLLVLVDPTGSRPAPERTVEPQSQEQQSRKVADRLPGAAEAKLAATSGADLSSLPVLSLSAPFLSVSGTALLNGQQILKLDGVEGPGAGELCFDEAGARWACGLQARAALHNLLAGKELACQPRRALESSQISAQCAIRTPGAASWADQDLAYILVKLGWARPVGQLASRLLAEMEEARHEKRGLWRGGWKIASPQSGSRPD